MQKYYLLEQFGGIGTGAVVYIATDIIPMDPQRGYVTAWLILERI